MNLEIIIYHLHSLNINISEEVNVNPQNSFILGDWVGRGKLAEILQEWDGWTNVHTVEVEADLEVEEVKEEDEEEKSRVDQPYN